MTAVDTKIFSIAGQKDEKPLYPLRLFDFQTIHPARWAHGGILAEYLTATNTANG
jgi:hypothetical protein